jgi:IK cytokine
MTAFQFGLKMQDGRNTRKQNRGLKLTNDLHKINKILAGRVRRMGQMNGCHYGDGLGLPSSRSNVAEVGWFCSISPSRLFLQTYP